MQHQDWPPSCSKEGMGWEQGLSGEPLGAQRLFGLWPITLSPSCRGQTGHVSGGVSIPSSPFSSASSECGAAQSSTASFPRALFSLLVL